MASSLSHTKIYIYDVDLISTFFCAIRNAKNEFEFYFESISIEIDGYWDIVDWDYEKNDLRKELILDKYRKKKMIVHNLSELKNFKKNNEPIIIKAGGPFGRADYEEISLFLFKIAESNPDIYFKADVNFSDCYSERLVRCELKDGTISVELRLDSAEARSDEYYKYVGKKVPRKAFRDCFGISEKDFDYIEFYHEYIGALDEFGEVFNYDRIIDGLKECEVEFVPPSKEEFLKLTADCYDYGEWFGFYAKTCSKKSNFNVKKTNEDLFLKEIKKILKMLYSSDYLVD